MIAAKVVKEFQWRRVLPLLRRELRLWQMVPGVSLARTVLVEGAPSEEELKELCRVP